VGRVRKGEGGGTKKKKGKKRRRRGGRREEGGGEVRQKKERCRWGEEADGREERGGVGSREMRGVGRRGGRKGGGKEEGGGVKGRGRKGGGNNLRFLGWKNGGISGSLSRNVQRRRNHAGKKERSRVGRNLLDSKREKEKRQGRETIGKKKVEKVAARLRWGGSCENKAIQVERGGKGKKRS